MNLVIEKNKKIGEITIFLKLFQLHKSFLLMISDKESMGIGNVTLGSPPTIEGIKPLSTSYNIFGVNTKLLSTIITESSSFILKAPILLLLFLKTKKSEEEIIKPLIIFLNETLRGITDKLE